MTRIPLVAPHWLGAEDTRWPNSLVEVFENFGTILCCEPIELSSGISSKPSVGVGLKEINDYKSVWLKVCLSHLTVEMSRHFAGPGGARAYWGEVGGLERADILIEHCNTLSRSAPATGGHRGVTSQHKYTGDAIIRIVKSTHCIALYCEHLACYAINGRVFWQSLIKDLCTAGASG